MYRSFADSLSITLLVLAVAIGLSLGVFGIVRADLEENSYELLFQDKTAADKYSPSATDSGSYDGMLSRGEVLLVCAIQDSGMSGSKQIQVGSGTIAAKSGASQSLVESYVKYGYAAVKNHGNAKRFAANYRYSDQTYNVTAQ